MTPKDKVIELKKQMVRVLESISKEAKDKTTDVDRVDILSIRLLQIIDVLTNGRAELTASDMETLIHPTGERLGRAEAFKQALAIVRDQPFYPDTNVGMTVGLRQQWVKDQIFEKIKKVKDQEPLFDLFPKVKEH